MFIEVNNESAMKEFGARLGALLRGGETIELVGDVGAGKTTLVKGLAIGLTIDDDVQSPSFTISRVYDARDDLHLAHYDFYRLNDAGIMAAELAETTADDKTTTVIEWAQIVDGVLPADRLTISIVPVSEDGRSVEMRSGGESSARLLEQLA